MGVLKDRWYRYSGNFLGIGVQNVKFFGGVGNFLPIYQVQKPPILGVPAVSLWGCIFSKWIDTTNYRDYSEAWWNPQVERLKQTQKIDAYQNACCTRSTDRIAILGNMLMVVFDWFNSLNASGFNVLFFVDEGDEFDLLYHYLPSWLFNQPPPLTYPRQK